MLSRKCWARVGAIHGRTASFFFKSLLKFSTTITTARKMHPRDADFADYLINSLGFSREAAMDTVSKVPRSRPFQEKADSVVNYLENLGLTKTHIRSMVSGCPRLLFCEVDKSLEPKVKYFREIGLSGSDLITVITGYRHFWKTPLDSQIKFRVAYVRQLVGTDKNVAKVLKRCSKVIGSLKTEMVEANLKLLRSYGLTDDNIVKLIVNKPGTFFISKPEDIEDILRRAENVFRIPRESKMFYYGVELLFSLSESNINEKFGVFRSFGWSDLEIHSLVRRLPLVLSKGAPSIRKVVDYYMNELGFTPDYLANRPLFFTYSFEKRVKPRNEVLKILNEKKLKKRKIMLVSALSLSESEFMTNYILPYKDILPDMCEAYISKTR